MNLFLVTICMKFWIVHSLSSSCMEWHKASTISLLAVYLSYLITSATPWLNRPLCCDGTRGKGKSYLWLSCSMSLHKETQWVLIVRVCGLNAMRGTLGWGSIPSMVLSKIENTKSYKKCILFNYHELHIMEGEEA